MPTSPDDVRHRFAYHPPEHPYFVSAHEDVRATMCDAALFVLETVGAGREQSLAITALEEAMMWANAGIARA